MPRHYFDEDGHHAGYEVPRSMLDSLKEILEPLERDRFAHQRLQLLDLSLSVQMTHTVKAVAAIRNPASPDLVKEWMMSSTADTELDLSLWVKALFFDFIRKGYVANEFTLVIRNILQHFLHYHSDIYSLPEIK